MRTQNRLRRTSFPGVMGKDGQPHNNNNNNVVGIGASRKQWHLNNLGGRDNNPNAPDANEAIDDVTSDVILLECEKRLDCLVVQIEHVLCRLLSHPHLTAGRISVKNVGGGRDPDDVPLCYSSQGETGSSEVHSSASEMDCDDYGATTIEMRDDTEEDYDGGDQEEKEKNYRWDGVASVEIAESIVRDNLEPLLNDFLNNNSENLNRPSHNGTSFNISDQAWNKDIQDTDPRDSTRFGSPRESELRPGDGAKVQMQLQLKRSDGTSNGHMETFGAVNGTEDHRIQRESESSDSSGGRGGGGLRVWQLLAKIQHWAENCPFSPVRLALSIFLQSFQQSGKLPLDFSPLLVDHLKTKYIPASDIDCHNGMAVVEKVYRQHVSRMRRKRRASRRKEEVDGGGDDSEEKSRTEETCPRKVEDSTSSSSSTSSSEISLQVEKYRLYVGTFRLHGLRVPNVHFLLAYHPQYMKEFLSFEHSLHSHPHISPSNFDPTLVSYLTLMAAARFDCSYLIRSVLELLPEDDPFAQFGFSPPSSSAASSSTATTMRGEDSSAAAMSKQRQRNMLLDVKALVNLNALLAHAPWKINAHTIKEVVEGSGGSRQWPQDKLVQAVIILAHFHSLSGFILATGVMPPPNHDYFKASNTSAATSTQTAQNSSHARSNEVIGVGASQSSSVNRENGVGENVSGGLSSPSNTCSSSNSLAVQSNFAGPSSPSSSGGVTPVSGRATPAHFFADKEEGADFIEQLQTIPHKSDYSSLHSDSAHSHSYQSIVRHLSRTDSAGQQGRHNRNDSNNSCSLGGGGEKDSVTQQSHGPSRDASLEKVGASLGSDGGLNGRIDTVSVSASGGSGSGSSNGDAILKISSASLKSAQISQQNRKYLGVEMGHVDFGVSSATGTEGGGGEEDEWTETNEESVSRVVSSLDFLLEQRGGDNRNSSTATLRRQAEQRSKTAFSLTYNKFGKYGQSGSVNTTSFRRTIPCVCLMTHGILYDDFNYDLIDFFSGRQAGRLFIHFAKRALVQPHSITRQFFLSCNPYQLDHSEMVHICILVMEARMQIELYYAMRAINDYREMQHDD